MNGIRHKGFTLIELLIVVAIIAILAAIAVPNFLEAQVRSKVSRTKNDLRTLATALESYAVDHRHYPPYGTLPTIVMAQGTEPQILEPYWVTTPIAYLSSDSPLRDPFRVKVNDDWLTPGEVANRRSVDANVAQYMQQRNALAGSLPGEIALARWCADHGLPDQARFHWFQVLSSQPHHEEALRGLGVRWYRGRLMPRDEIAQMKRRDRQTAKNPFQVSPAQQRVWERKVAAYRNWNA